MRLRIGKLAVAGLLLVIFLLLSFFFFDNDPLFFASPELEPKLVIYEKQGDSGPAIGYLLEYHGEAPSHAMVITFVRWGIGHPIKFDKFIHELSAEEYEKLRGRISFAMKDSVQCQSFAKAFEDSVSDRITRLQSDCLEDVLKQPTNVVTEE